MADCAECGGHADARVYEVMADDEGNEVVEGRPHCLHCAIVAQTNGSPPAAVVWRSDVGVTTNQ